MTNGRSYTGDRSADSVSTSTGHRWVDPESGQLCETVVAAVAEVQGVDLSELAVLADFIDPIALNRLFRVPSNFPSERIDGHVQFAYDDLLVTVGSDGEIRVDHAPLEANGSGAAGSEAVASADAPRGPTTRGELGERLEALVGDAVANGVDISGGYGIRTTDGSHWNCELFPVERSREESSPTMRDAGDEI